MKHIEYEERVLISKSDYEKVIEDIKLSGKEISHLIIENIYLDNDDSFIEKNHYMLRVRTTNGTNQELTLKIQNKDNSNIEINEALNSHPEIDKNIDGEFKDYKEKAKLVTDRLEVQFEDHLLVIDKNTYHGIEDYDLEIESENQHKSKEIISFYCKKYSLKYDPNYKTKSHRAFERIHQLDKKR